MFDTDDPVASDSALAAAIRDHISNLFTETLSKKSIAGYFGVHRNDVTKRIIGPLLAAGHAERVGERFRIRLSKIPPTYHVEIGLTMQLIEDVQDFAGSCKGPVSADSKSS